MVKPKLAEKKEIKIKMEINKINRKQNETKSWFFEKINKID